MAEMSGGFRGVPRTPIEDVVARTAEDWVHPAELMHVIRRQGIEGSELQRLASIGVVAVLVASDLVVVGDVTDHHIPWGCSPGEAIVRVAQEWMARADPSVMPGELFWLDATDEGHALGETVWAREAEVL